MEIANFIARYSSGYAVYYCIVLVTAHTADNLGMLRSGRPDRL